uniref:PUM-HD domain-containing protein n=1 Tax=Mesocestoides corti TaxID=53468 RepID=A0A5K3EXY4_MESCO
MTSSEQTKAVAPDLTVDQMLIGTAPPGFQTDVNNLISNRVHVAENTYPSQWAPSLDNQGGALSSDRGTPHLPDGFDLTDDDGADLTIGGTGVRGLGDHGSTESGNEVAAAAALAHHFRGLSVFDASRTNHIWAVGAERKSQNSGDEFNTSSGDVTNISITSMSSVTPAQIGSIASPQTCAEGSNESGILSASATGPMPGIDIHSLWASRGQPRRTWITDRLFGSEDSTDPQKRGRNGDESQSLDEAAPGKLSDINGSAWEWGESLLNTSSWRALYDNSTTETRSFSQVVADDVHQSAPSSVFPGLWAPKVDTNNFSLPPQMNMSSSSHDGTADFAVGEGVFTTASSAVPPSDIDGSGRAGLYGSLFEKKYGVGASNVFGVPLGQSFLPFDTTNGKPTFGCNSSLAPPSTGLSPVRNLSGSTTPTTTPAVTSSNNEASPEPISTVPPTHRPTQPSSMCPSMPLPPQVDPMSMAMAMSMFMQPQTAATPAPPPPHSNSSVPTPPNAWNPLVFNMLMQQLASAAQNPAAAAALAAATVFPPALPPPPPHPPSQAVPNTQPQAQPQTQPPADLSADQTRLAACVFFQMHQQMLLNQQQQQQPPTSPSQQQQQFAQLALQAATAAGVRGAGTAGQVSGALPAQQAAITPYGLPQMGMLQPTGPPPHTGGSPLFPPGANVSPTAGGPSVPSAPAPPPGFARVVAAAAKNFSSGASSYSGIETLLSSAIQRLRNSLQF